MTKLTKKTILLSVPGKLMESVVASNKTEHINKLDLSNCNQWVYKRSFSTELPMAKMTKDWRKALDRKQVACVVFVDFRKAFDAIPHVVQ